MARAAEPEPAEDINEADSVGRDAMHFGGVDHHEPHRVVDDAEHGEFSVDPIDGLAAENIHPHRGLEVTHVRLYLPSATVEVGHGRLGIPSGIKQRGDERHLS